jgi:hypothetical protein
VTRKLLFFFSQRVSLVIYKGRLNKARLKRNKEGIGGDDAEILLYQRAASAVLQLLGGVLDE